MWVKRDYRDCVRVCLLCVLRKMNESHLTSHSCISPTNNGQNLSPAQPVLLQSRHNDSIHTFDMTQIDQEDALFLTPKLKALLCCIVSVRAVLLWRSAGDPWLEECWERKGNRISEHNKATTPEKITSVCVCVYTCYIF